MTYTKPHIKTICISEIHTVCTSRKETADVTFDVSVNDTWSEKHRIEL